MSGRFVVAVVTTVLEGAVLAWIVLWGLPRVGIHMPLWGLIVILGALVANAVFFYQVGSRALRRRPVFGLGTLVGGRGKAVTSLAPDGVVKVSGELWQATSASGLIDAGEEVTIVEQDGLRLIVVKSVALKEAE